MEADYLKMDDEEETLLDVQHSPLFKLKRKVLFMALFLFYFLCGLEYSITIPSALLDGKYSPADRTFMLTEVGLYPLAAMLTSLVLGHLYDRTKRIRTIMITSAILQVVGNFVYAIHYKKWLSLIGRFISGLGDGHIAVSVAEITYLYEDHNRVGMLCILELGRVFGFMNGPVVNFFIVKWSTVHQWTLDKKTLPGYVMGCSWTVVAMISFCCVHNLALEVIEKFNLNDSPFLRAKTRIYNAEENKYEKVEEMKKYEKMEEMMKYEKVEEMKKNIDESDYLNPFDLEEELSDDNENDSDAESKKSATFDEKASNIFPIPEQPPPKPTLKEKFNSIFSPPKYRSLKEKLSDNSQEMIYKAHVSQIFHIEIALLMVMNFVFWYSQTTFLMFCSYITTFEFKWGPTEIGLTYVVGFVVVIAMLVIMYFLRESLEKKHIFFVVIAMAFIQISLALLIYEDVPKEKNKRITVFMISGVLVFASIPFTLVCFKTLVTSMVRPGIQGTLQGLTSSIVRLAVITGLLLSIVTVHGRQVYASVMTVLCFITIITFFLSYDMIRRKQREGRLVKLS